MSTLSCVCTQGAGFVPDQARLPGVGTFAAERCYLSHCLRQVRGYCPMGARGGSTVRHRREKARGPGPGEAMCERTASPRLLSRHPGGDLGVAMSSYCLWTNGSLKAGTAREDGHCLDAPFEDLAPRVEKVGRLRDAQVQSLC